VKIFLDDLPLCGDMISGYTGGGKATKNTDGDFAAAF